MSEQEIKPAPPNDLNKANVEPKPVTSPIPDRVAVQSIVMEVRNSSQEKVTKVDTPKTDKKEQ